MLRLAADGGTIPFIARYRKEATGGLDEVAIEKVIDGKEEWDRLIQRQTFIAAEIETQGKLTPELKAAVLSCYDSARLEDLYLPYKKKKKTKAALAKEAGLEPLADWIWNCAHGTETPQPGQTLELWALTFRNEEKGILEVSAVLAGAQDILVERLSEDQALRGTVREALTKKGFLFSTKGEKAKPNSKYEKYFTYQESVESLRQPQNSHRYLALRRGWLEGELANRVGGPLDNPEFETALISSFEIASGCTTASPGAEILKKAAHSSFRDYVRPAIESEIHRALKTVADEVAIAVFSENVRKLLLAAPLGAKTVLGVDPGIRTGCKLALVDSTGKFTLNHVIELQTDEQKNKSKELLSNLLAQAPVDAIAVGNGTAGRETELFLRSFLKEKGLNIPVVLISESGASVYSASEVAREEFPDLDLTIRGAISIARRLQDPLAELVKVDPKSIGVGQYQHDVPPALLKRSLQRVVESCVNSVGVNLNTASYHLLAYVSGIGPVLAKSIVEKRGSAGLFKSRQDLLAIPFFSAKTFEQAAGFLRIPDGTNPLDNTGVHPERYPVLEEIASGLGTPVAQLLGAGAKALRSAAGLVEKLGEFTFRDLVGELEKPGRDPRENFVPFSFREDIFEMKDLKPGLLCPGIVTNVTNFGAFVDIGIHQDGLVHLSQLANRFVRDPHEVVAPGDRVQVRILEVNLEKKQISLSMKPEAPPKVQTPRPPRQDNRQQNRPQQQRHAQGGGGGGRGPKPPPKPRQPPRPKFGHNPFAALAALKNPPKK
ncbi:RNA-binding transcriptional accessory protein [bacterium]|nr:RNA-binding transcriptional accessory protein [bacterium]